MSEDAQTRYVLVIFQSGRSASSLDYMTTDLFRTLQGVIRQAGIKPGATVDVWIDSPGGYADAAYKLALLFRRTFAKVTIVVPDYAKSAATLLALAGDTLIMEACAELGPLDAQIIHPTRDDPISALDVANAVEHIADMAVQTIIRGGAEVMRYTGLQRRQVLKAMTTFGAALMKPLLEQLDPSVVHQANSQLDIARQYAVRLLKMKRTGLELDPGQDQADETLAERLVSEYPSHGFVIDRDEARRLGLNITDLETYDLKDEVLALHDQYRCDGKLVVSLQTLADLQMTVSNFEAATTDEGEADDTSMSTIENGLGEGNSAEGQDADYEEDLTGSESN